MISRKVTSWLNKQEFDDKSPRQSIESARDLICLQYRNKERTILWKDGNSICPRFKFLETPATLVEESIDQQVIWFTFGAIDSTS